jgi:hypothetical protein
MSPIVFTKNIPVATYIIKDLKPAMRWVLIDTMVETVDRGRGTVIHDTYAKTWTMTLPIDATFRTKHPEILEEMTEIEIVVREGGKTGGEIKAARH